MGQRYRKMEEDQKPESGLISNQDIAEIGGLEPKIKTFSKKKFKLGNVASKLVWLKSIADGSLGAKPE